MRTLFLALCLAVPVHAGELDELRTSVTIARGFALHEPGRHAALETHLPDAERDLALAEQAGRADRARGDRLAAAPLTRLRSELLKCTSTAHSARARSRGRRIISSASR